MTHTYADLGPPIPAEAPDGEPLTIDRIEQLAVRNGLNEAIILVDAKAWTLVRPVEWRPVRLIIKANPHTGDIISAAYLHQPGAGFVACAPELLPGNLIDLVRTMLTDGS